MNKLFPIFFGCLLSSCTVQEYVQIIEVGSHSIPAGENNYVYTDGDCSITYNFWTLNGNPGFIIKNNTDDILYLNLAQTFYKVNDIAYDYYLYRTYDKRANISLASSAANNTTVIGHNSGVTYQEKEVIAIPPHAVKSFDEYIIASDVFQDCSVKLFPRNKDKESKTFAESDSPLKFGNYITYKVGVKGDYKHITNDFFVASFSNYKSSQIEEKTKSGCKETIKAYYNKYRKGTRFYINYSSKHPNDWSEDAKEKLGDGGFRPAL